MDSTGGAPYSALHFVSTISAQGGESPPLQEESSEYLQRLAEADSRWLTDDSTATKYGTRQSRGSSFGGTPESQAGVRSSVVTLVMSVLGASLLIMPYVCFKCGIIVFVAILVIMAITTNFSLRLLTECVKSTTKTSYQAVGDAAFGRKGAVFTTVVIIVQLTGSATAYLAIVGDCLQAVVKYLPSNIPVFWQVLVSVLVIFPLCMLRRLHALRYTRYVIACCQLLTPNSWCASTVALGLLAVLVIVLVIDGVGTFANPEAPLMHMEIVWVGTLWDVLSVMPVVTCAYMCHQNLFPVSNELARPTGRRIGRVTGFAMAVCMVVYLLCGVGGYLTFLAFTKGNVLVSYRDHAIGLVPGVVVQVALYGIGAALVLSYPVGVAFELRRGLHRLCCRSRRRFSWSVHTALNVIIVSSTTTVAILVPNAETLFAMTGASTSTTLVFILPGMIYLWTSSNLTGSKVMSTPSRARDILAVVLSTVGVVLVPASLGILIYKQSTAG